MGIEITNIFNEAKAEISRIAASAYSEDGVSLYDTIRVTSRDADYLEDYFEGAMANMNVRFKGLAPYDSAEEEVSLPLEDSVATENELQPILRKYIVSSICADWFRRKYVVKHEEYAAEAQNCLEKIVVLVKTRREPVKGGILL